MLNQAAPRDSFHSAPPLSVCDRSKTCTIPAMPSSARARSAAIDLVRVVAITAVVLRHTFYDPEGVIAQIVCPWAIAIFFVLTGYLWSSRKTLQQDVDSRATGLLIPYVAWMMTISIPYFTWLFATEGSGALYYLAAYAYGPQLAVFPYSACWFFTVMFFSTLR